MRRRNITPDTKREPLIRRPYVPLDKGDDPKSWRRRTNVLFILLFLSSIIALIALGLSVGEWVRDGNARRIIEQSQSMVQMTEISVLDSRRIAQETTQDKAQAEAFQMQISDFMAENENQTAQIAAINVSGTVQYYAQVNQTLVDKSRTVTLEINALNKTLQKIRSMANALTSSEVLLESGTCNLQGDVGSTSQINYQFYRQDFASFSLYFYVFGTSDFVTIDPSLTVAKITSCSNPILGGVEQVDFTLKDNLDRFESDPINWVGGVTSNTTELLIHKAEGVVMGGAGQLKIKSVITYWLQFF